MVSHVGCVDSRHNAYIDFIQGNSCSCRLLQYDVYEQTTGTDRRARVHAVFHNTQKETIQIGKNFCVPLSNSLHSITVCTMSNGLFFWMDEIGHLLLAAEMLWKMKSTETHLCGNVITAHTNLLEWWWFVGAMQWMIKTKANRIANLQSVRCSPDERSQGLNP